MEKMIRQDFHLIEAVRLPSLAIVQAINLTPVPLPSTSTSYFSGSLTQQSFLRRRRVLLHR